MVDTIFALSTAYAKSGVAVFRISGPDAIKCLVEFGIKQPNPREAAFRKIYNQQGDQIDEGLILFFPSPSSFTGEDVCEIQVHGSIAVIKMLYEALGAISGLRPAEPGEFAKRAFYNGKMDLTQAEGLADLIDSETVNQQRQAIRQMGGNLSNLYGKWREEIVKLLALTEAYIDFPDEEIPENIIDDVNNQVTSLKAEIEQHLLSKGGEIIRSGVTIAIIGPTNVGKSSLLNHLAKRDAAIVSEIAGTTRDQIEVHLEIKGHLVKLIDTAGIRETKDIIEQEGIKRAIKSAEEADIVINMSENGNWQGGPYPNQIYVANKIEKNPHIADKYHGEKVIKISVKENYGIDQLLEVISSIIAEKVDSNKVMITRERYRKALKESLNNLERFSLGKEIELAAEDLRMAARAIGRITGAVDVDSILDVVFSSFCIGK